MKKAESIDSSLFIFSPDDISIIKNKQKVVVRDNVLFELGLFIGSIGKERCFILKPRSIDLHFPTDLLGVTPADYEHNRSDGDLASAVNHACVLIKKQMEKLKPLNAISTPPKPIPISVNVNNELTGLDFAVLGTLIGTATQGPDGYAINAIKNDLKNYSPRIDLTIIKLEKLGYIERRIQSEDMNGYEYYSYTITTDGIELLIKNEDKAFDRPLTEQPVIVDDGFDDIPF